MIVWLSVAAIVFALAVVAVGVFSVRYRRGEIERTYMIAAAVLIAVALLLVVLSELVAGEISGLVFFLWLPFWLIWQRRRRDGHA
jgi:hypothetical protein